MTSIKAQTVCTRDQGVLTPIKSMNGKAMEFDVFHVHIGHWYRPLPYIESLNL
jgi:hypothetical protein